MVKILGIIWSWFKKNWLVIFAVIGITFLAGYGYSAIKSLFDTDTNLSDRIEQQEIRHIQDLAKLNKIAQDQIAAQNVINDEYDARITEIDERFTEELAKIRANSRARQKQLSGDPTKLGETITGVFGIPNGGIKP